MSKTIRVASGCTICKACVCFAPTLFSVPEKEISAIVLKNEPDSDEEIKDLINAVRNCPVRIISYKSEAQSKTKKTNKIFKAKNPFVQ